MSGRWNITCTTDVVNCVSIRFLSFYIPLLFSIVLQLICLFFLPLIIFHIFRDHSLLLSIFLSVFSFVILLLFSTTFWCIIFFLLIFLNWYISFFVINFLFVSVVVWLPRFLLFVSYSTFRLRLHVLTRVSQVKRFVECNNTQWTLQR